MSEVKPYRVHTRVVIDMASGAVLEDEWHYSTVQPALCGSAVVAGAAIVGAVVTAGAAIYSADRQRYANNMQQDAMLRQAEYNRKMAEHEEATRQLQVQAAMERNAYEMQMAGLQEERQMMMLELYGMQQEMLYQRAEIMAQRYALEQEVYNWQLATLDWEAQFRMQQAEFIAKQGEYERSLYGKETAAVLARHRARMAAAGWDVGTGSPLAVLGKTASDRQYVSDIMKFGTDVNVWEKEFEAAQLQNAKNKVVFGKSGSELGFRGSLLDLKGDLAAQRAKALDTGLSLQASKLQQGLLASERLRIGEGAAIDLQKYILSQDYADVATGMQSSVYNAAAGAATVGGYLNAGSALFNGYQNYYAATKKGSTINIAYN